MASGPWGAIRETAAAISCELRATRSTEAAAAVADLMNASMGETGTCCVTEAIERGIVTHIARFRL